MLYSFVQQKQRYTANDKEVFLNATKEAILKEAEALTIVTEADTLICTANLAIQQIIGTIRQ